MLIVVSGKKRSGKDTFYHIAKDFIKDKVVLRYAFADPVKQYAKKYFNVDETSDKEKYRFILQGIGQMFRQQVNPEYWIQTIHDQIEEDIKIHGKENVVSIVTDCRYLNEVFWAKRNSGLVVRILRPALDSPDTHQSEIDLDSYTFEHFVGNTGDLKKYTRSVQEWLQEHVLT